MRVTTQQRRQLILTLIGAEAVTTQDELVAALGRQGVVASQASVSRDIRALGLVKIGGRYAPPPAVVQVVPDDPLPGRLRQGVVSIAAAGPNMIVLKTTVGDASGLAFALDRAGWSEVVGTLAGDDTIFIATPSARASRDLAVRLRRLSGRP